MSSEPNAMGALFKKKKSKAKKANTLNMKAMPTKSTHVDAPELSKVKVTNDDDGWTDDSKTKKKSVVITQSQQLAELGDVSSSAPTPSLPVTASDTSVKAEDQSNTTTTNESDGTPSAKGPVSWSALARNETDAVKASSDAQTDEANQSADGQSKEGEDQEANDKPKLFQPRFKRTGMMSSGPSVPTGAHEFPELGQTASTTTTTTSAWSSNSSSSSMRPKASVGESEPPRRKPLKLAPPSLPRTAPPTAHTNTNTNSDSDSTKRSGSSTSESTTEQPWRRAEPSASAPSSVDRPRVTEPDNTPSNWRSSANRTPQASNTPPGERGGPGLAFRKSGKSLAELAGESPAETPPKPPAQSAPATSTPSTQTTVEQPKPAPDAPPASEVSSGDLKAKFGAKKKKKKKSSE